VAITTLSTLRTGTTSPGALDSASDEADADLEEFLHLGRKLLSVTKMITVLGLHTVS